MTSQGKGSPETCRTCGEDPVCCKPPKFCSQCGVKDPLKSETVSQVASDGDTPNTNENRDETGTLKESDDCGSSNTVGSPLQETDSEAVSQFACDGDAARSNETGDRAARQDHTSPSSVNFPLQESGAIAVENVAADKWLEGINARFGLLVCGQSSYAHERRIFSKDCEDLSEVLGLNQHDKPQSRNMVIPLVNLETNFLALVAEREQQITDALLRYLETVFPRWSGSTETEKLIRDIYTRIRLLKALTKVRTLWEDTNERIGVADTDEYLQVLEVVLEERWKKANDESDPFQRAQMLSSGRKLTARALDDKLNHFLQSYSKKLTECTIMSKFLCESTKFEVLTLSDEIFTRSLFLSGFPNHAKALKEWPEYMPFFSNSIAIINSIENKANEAHMPEFQSRATHQMIASKNADDIFHELIRFLAEWQGHNCVPDQWIWVHYSGHGNGYLQLEEPFQNMHAMVDLTCELFSDVVVSLDCCFPNVSSYIPHPRMCLMLSNEKNFEAYMRTSNVCSIFTKLLTFALHGFPSERCYSTMKLVFPTIGICTCETCIAYRDQLKPTNIMMKKDKQSQDKLCIYCEKLMEKCATENFIFPLHIDQFFKEHFCKKIPQPVITFQCHSSENQQRPLVRVVRKAAGKET